MLDDNPYFCYGTPNIEYNVYNSIFTPTKK